MQNGYVGRIVYSNQHRDKHNRIKVAKTSAYVCVQKTYMSPLQKVREQETKTFAMLGGVGMANESTKNTQASCGWLNTMNEQGWHD